MSSEAVTMPVKSRKLLLVPALFCAAGRLLVTPVPVAAGPASTQKPAVRPAGGSRPPGKTAPAVRASFNPQLRAVPGTLPNRLKPVWKFKTAGPVLSGAAVDSARVYIGSDDGFIYGLRRADGGKLWAFKTGGPVEATPYLLGGAVIAGSADGYLYSVDAATGQLRWKYQTEDKINGGANSGLAPDGKTNWIVVGSYDYRLHCVNAATGKKVWTYETENYVNGTPAVSAGRVIFGGCDGILHVIRLADGKKVRTIPAKDYIPGSVALDGRFAYLGDYGNEVICANVDSGKTLWSYRDRSFPYFSSPAVTTDRIVIGCRDKQVHCIRRQDGRGIWKFRTRGKVDSSPMICGDKVVVGSEDGKLYLLDLATGQEIWSYTIGSPVIGSPAVSSGLVVVGGSDGYVYAFAAR